MIAPYPLTNSNYIIVIRLLQRRYGNPDLLKESLHTELRNLTDINDNPINLRKSLLYVNRIILQLKNLGEDIEHPQIRQSIEIKLPTKLRIKIHKYRHENNQFSTSELLKYLDTYTQTREEVEEFESEYANDNNLVDKDKTAHYNHVNKNDSDECSEIDYEEFENPENEYITSNDIETEELNKPSYKYCQFCQNDTHKAIDCRIYSNPVKRYDKSFLLGLCTNCLKDDHKKQDCTSKFNCKNCNERHHTLLCQKNHPSYELCNSIKQKY
jgi:hypothetical protein